MCVRIVHLSMSGNYGEGNALNIEKFHYFDDSC